MQDISIQYVSCFKLFAKVLSYSNKLLRKRLGLVLVLVLVLMIQFGIGIGIEALVLVLWYK